MCPPMCAKVVISACKQCLEKQIFDLTLAFIDPLDNPFLEKVMKITHLDPWSFVGQLNRDLNTVVNRNPARWTPAVDIIEESDRFLLRADVPGVSPDDIDVSMDNGVLSVSGERHAEESKENAGPQRIERTHGRFVRRFTLPETADAEGITAKSHNGILEVAIPKLPEIQARRITVEAA